MLYIISDFCLFLLVIRFFFIHRIIWEMIQLNFKIGDLVTRISYKHDIVFRIIGFNSNTAFLKGVDLRLIADCDINDLVKADKVLNDDKAIIDANMHDIKLDRSQYFYLPGKILHIDADILLSNQFLYNNIEKYFASIV